MTIPPDPRILFGDDRYRVVLNGTIVTLEWQDTDAAGSIRWLHVARWNRQDKNAQSSHADIAMDCILKNYDMIHKEKSK